MAKITPKVIFIGDPRIGQFFENKKVDWEFQPYVKDVMSFYAGLQSGELDVNNHAILIVDQFFDVTGNDYKLEQLVAQYAQHCFVGIINYKEDYREEMRRRIDAQQENLGSSSKYYFIQRRNPIQELNLAVRDYIKTSDNDLNSAVLDGRDIDMQEYEDPEDEKAQKIYEDSASDVESKYFGQVIAVTSSKGGSGKSTVALSLATFLAHSSENSVREGLEDRPLKVCVVDLDVRDGQVGFLTNFSSPTVISLRVNGMSRENIEETVIHSPRLKVDLLLASKKPRLSEETPPDFYVELIHNLRTMYDYIILDTSVNYLDPLLEEVAYPTADNIVFVTDIVMNSVLSMARWVHEVASPTSRGGMGISKNKVGIVINKALSNVNMSGDKILAAAQGIRIITAIPSNPKIVAHAANIGALEALLRHPDLVPAFQRLAKAIVGRRYQLSNKVDPT